MEQFNQDDADLNFYEGTRKKIVSSLMEKGVPQDNESIGLVLKAIDGGSRTILTKKRLEVDKENSEVISANQALIAEILKSSPTRQQQLQRTTPLPEIDMSVPGPGETEIGTKQVTYKEIMGHQDQK